MGSSSNSSKGKKNIKALKKQAFTSPLVAAHASGKAEETSTTTSEKDSVSDNQNKIRLRQHEDEHHIANKGVTNQRLDRSKERREGKRAKLQADDDEEKRLTSLLFGTDKSSNIVWKDDENDHKIESENSAGESLFQIDRVGEYTLQADDDDGDASNFQPNPNLDNDDWIDNKGTKSAWIDEDDERLAVSLVSKADRVKKLRVTKSEDVVDGRDYERRLRDRFQASAVARTDWAQMDKLAETRLNKASDGDSDDESQQLKS